MEWLSHKLVMRMMEQLWRNQSPKKKRIIPRTIKKEKRKQIARGIATASIAGKKGTGSVNVTN